MDENYTDYCVGDKIQNVSPDSKKGKNYMQYGLVTEVWGGTVRVQYDNGNSGESNNPRRYYKIIARKMYPITQGGQSAKSNNVMNTIKNFVRNLTLSTSEKLLQKYNLKTDCGSYTDQARELVIEKLVKDNEAYLIEVATNFDAEVKAEAGK